MNRADTTAAARLLQYAATPSVRPTPDSDYRALLDRYRTDAEFAEAVVAVADGLGLYVHAASPLGLIVTGDRDGPFRVTLDNCGLPLRSSPVGTRLQDRLLFGLVLVGVAAYAYPNGEALTETTAPTVRAADLNRFLTRNAENLTVLAEADGVGERDAQLGDAARRWLKLPEVLPAERTGNNRRDCQRRYITDLLSWLVSVGRARREPSLADERGDVYRLNDRFRIGIAETAETLAFSMLARRDDRDEA
jgi:hypothetical protein